jgi:hypothetical protein
LAGVAEPASYTWTFSSSPAAVGSMLAYAGVSSSSPIQTSAAQVAASKLITAPAVTTSVSGSMLVGFFGIARQATISQPAGMGELTEITSPGTVTYPVAGESAEELRSSAGDTAPRVATSTVSGPNIGQVLVLNPA